MMELEKAGFDELGQNRVQLYLGFRESNAPSRIGIMDVLLLSGIRRSDVYM